MFVQSNTLKACLDYVKSRLENQFSASEIRQIQREIFYKMFQFNATDLILKGDYRLTESELLLVRDVVKRLQNHEPLQYIIGYTEFCDLKILCDKRALIPRPETEELVWKILEATDKTDQNYLDLCTGTGCIALALKHHRPEAAVWAVELSQDAFNLAKKNTQILNLDINLVEGNALLPDQIVELKNKKWSCIVSNPPYIPHAEKTSMAPNVLDYEPHLALFVDDHDPLIFYKRIAEFAFQNLVQHGKLAFELHENRAAQVAQFCTNLGFSAVEIFEDLQGKQRMLLARL